MSKPDPNDFGGNTRQQFEYLGRYVQSFELLVDEIRNACIMIASHGTDKRELISIILNQKVMSANALWDTFRHMLGHILEKMRKAKALDDRSLNDANNILSQMGDDCTKAFARRNDTLHATWMIGWKSQEQEDFSEILMRKGKPNSKGLSYAQTAKTVQDLKDACAHCDDLTAMVRSVGLWIGFADRVHIRKIFKRENGRWARSIVPPPDAGDKP